jgi:hypothetical protein
MVTGNGDYVALLWSKEVRQHGTAIVAPGNRYRSPSSSPGDHLSRSLASAAGNSICHT